MTSAGVSGAEGSSPKIASSLTDMSGTLFSLSLSLPPWCFTFCGLSTWPELLYSMVAYSSHTSSMGLQNLRACVPRDKGEVASRLRHGPRNWHTITCEIFHGVKQPQSPPRFKGKGIDPPLKGKSIKEIFGTIKVCCNFLFYESPSTVFPTPEKSFF